MHVHGSTCCLEGLILELFRLANDNGGSRDSWVMDDDLIHSSLSKIGSDSTDRQTDRPS